MLLSLFLPLYAWTPLSTGRKPPNAKTACTGYDWFVQFPSWHLNWGRERNERAGRKKVFSFSFSAKYELSPWGVLRGGGWGVAKGVLQPASSKDPFAPSPLHRPKYSPLLAFDTTTQRPWLGLSSLGRSGQKSSPRGGPSGSRSWSSSSKRMACTCSVAPSHTAFPSRRDPPFEMCSLIRRRWTSSSLVTAGRRIAPPPWPRTAPAWQRLACSPAPPSLAPLAAER